MNDTKHKIITDKTQVFNAICETLEEMTDLIKTTYGPASNKVLIEKTPYRMVVDDGVQIARDYESDNPLKNAIAKVIKETLIATNDKAKDGTTGSLLMLGAIFKEVKKLGSFRGRDIEIEIKKALEEVKEQLKKKSTQIKSHDDLLKVAKISFDDNKIATMVADLYHRLGKDAIIKIEKSSTFETYTESSDGIQFKSGYKSPYMVTNPERMISELQDPYFLITDYRIMKAEDVLPVLNLLASKGKQNIVIIADNVEESALSTLIVNSPRVINPETGKPGSIMSLAIACPQTPNKTQFLEDLAILTGSRAFMSSKGDDIKSVDLKDLGRAKSINSNQSETVIIAPQGDKQVIKKAITSLKKAIASEKDIKLKDKLKDRLAFFTNTASIIYVGANTDNERKALKYKVEDAVNSVKLAYNGGVVCGSGIGLATLKTSSHTLNKALKYPARQLRENMGLDDDIEFDENHVLNVVSGKTGKYLDVGVVDPTELLIAGVESAVSIASVLVTTTGMVVEYNEHKE